MYKNKAGGYCEPDIPSRRCRPLPDPRVVDLKQCVSKALGKYSVCTHSQGQEAVTR